MEKILESTNSDGLGETAWNEWGGVSSDFRLSAAHCWVLIAHGSKNEKNANLNTISTGVFQNVQTGKSMLATSLSG